MLDFRQPSPIRFPLVARSVRRAVYFSNRLGSLLGASFWKGFGSHCLYLICPRQNLYVCVLFRHVAHMYHVHVHVRAPVTKTAESHTDVQLLQYLRATAAPKPGPTPIMRATFCADAIVYTHKAGTLSTCNSGSTCKAVSLFFFFFFLSIRPFLKKESSID